MFLLKISQKFWFRFLVVLAKTLFKTSLSASIYILLTALLITGAIKPRTHTLVVLLFHSFDLAVQLKKFTTSE